MKKILTVLILTSMVFLSACSSKGPEKPSDCALDFWIAENVENIDFSEYEEIYGWFGAREFLGKGYHTIINEDGESVKPDHYVSYVITAYPDYSSGGQYVTEIVITDPNVQMYGLLLLLLLRSLTLYLRIWVTILRKSEIQGCIIKQ